jgi:hypothetical protein
MATYVTDPTLLAMFNSGSPPDEQAGGYWQLDVREMEREAKREARAQSDMRYREWCQNRAKQRF